MADSEKSWYKEHPWMTFALVSSGISAVVTIVAKVVSPTPPPFSSRWTVTDNTAIEAAKAAAAIEAAKATAGK